MPMRFPPSLLDEIRARLPVSEVAGRRVRLRRQGREFTGLSPFNAEKTPSFTVNDQKGFYHCFSSGKHGDIFRFLMETEGLSFPEAVERLAREAGVSLPAPDPRAMEREDRRLGLFEVVEAAAAYYEETLAGPSGHSARAYLVERGISPDLQRRFRLGYAPADRHGLKNHLASRRIPVDDMAKAGLLITGSEVAVPFDRFRDRLIFPITDLKGRVIAFGGRALQADQHPKYLNSPEGELFQKGQILFNLAAARRAGHERGTLIVGEGYTDVIALSGAGFANTVAPLGTALTEEQLVLLWRIVDEPVICFDGDSAGLRAAFRLVYRALPLLAPGKSLRFALLPEGQDPDDVVRDQGASAMTEIVAKARPLSEMMWIREAEAAPLDTPERRAAFEVRLRAAVGRIGDASVRRYYEAAVFDQLRRYFTSRPARAARSDRRGARSLPIGAERPVSSASLVRRLSGDPAALPSREAILLLTLVNHPELLDERIEEVAALEFTAPALDKLRSALLDISAAGTISREAVREHLQAVELAQPLARAERMWEASARAEWWVAPEAAAVDAARGWDHIATLHRKLVTLHKELKAAETALHGDPSEENWARLCDIQVQLASAAGTEALVEGFGQASGRPTGTF